MRTNAYCSAQSLATNILGMPPLHAEKSAQPYPYFDALGFRLMSLLRVTLALSGLLVAPQWQSALAVLLLLYVIYSAVAHGLVLYRESLLHARFWHWLDVGWGIAVIAASGGADSDYYLFFIYPIIVASLRRGTDEGAALSVAAVAGWLLVALLAAGGAGPGQWQQVLLRAAALLVLGYAIALWAGFEARQRKRLVLLGEMNRLPNPRFGPDRLIAATLELLRDFYRADRCIAVFGADGEPRIHVAPARAVAPELEDALLALPERCVVVANARPRWLRFLGARLRIEGVAEAELAAARAAGRELASSLGAGSWISVPLELGGGVLGRLYLLSRHGRFGSFDICLLRQAMDKFVPLVETVKLLDRLATDAAETERKKICLDLHDSAIQPYLGLKLGLEALRRKVEPTNALAGDIDDLYRMTQDSIAELRGYVRVLGGHAQRQAAALMEGLRRQVERFHGFYGIKVDVNLLSDVNLNDRLTAEVVQMVGESLSNIGRHTSSREVTINLSSSNDQLVTQIINHGGAGDAAWQRFTPVSLTRRAQHLGGSVEVAPQASGGTAVRVTIPL
ncbi:MAG: histidine kinase [Rhodocyclaceae bacterium]|nr:histidine kinase [Rhodocyclaceae bacterium]